ncbi:MAG: efflux RND transporter periplasmic adaptor subunit [Chloroflexota bacterium]
MMYLKRLMLFMMLSMVMVGCDAISDAEEDLIKASGVVEATAVSLSPKVPGTVIELFAAVGDQVEIGDQIMLLENETLQAQHTQALAAYDSAQAVLETAESGLASAEAGVRVAEINVRMARLQYQLTLDASRLAGQPERIKAWNANIPNEFELPVWYFNNSEEIAAAQQEVEVARETLRIEHANLTEVIDSVSNADLKAAEERLANAQAGFLVAEELQKRQAEQNGRKEVDDYVDSLYDAADAELTSAQAEYDSLISDVGAEDLIEARARVVVAEERYQIALDQLGELRVGDDALEVSLARLGVEQASAYAEQANAIQDQAQAGIEQAKQGVSQAQAILDLVELQIADLSVKATASGVVLARLVEVGESVQPGLMAFSIGKLSELTITVYVSEDQYGQIYLGQTAEVSVDSFPDEVFTATVLRIADQAEYTPRNVQTEEDRRTTVFAIELSVGDTDGKLKPGMPADVSFSN